MRDIDGDGAILDRPPSVGNRQAAIYIEDQHDRRLRTLLASWTLLVEAGGIGW
jgi:hypothetical protein